MAVARVPAILIVVSVLLSRNESLTKIYDSRRRSSR